MVQLWYGDDQAMLGLELARWVQEFHRKYPGAVVTKLGYAKGSEAELAQQFHQASYGGGLFADRRLVVAHGFLKAEPKGELAAEVRSFCESLPASTVVLFTEGERVVWSKSLAKLMREQADGGSVTIREFIPLSAPELEHWVVARATQEGGRLSPGVARLLVARVGGNVQSLAQEIAKLVSYRADAEVVVADIDMLVTAKVQDDVFVFLDAVGRRDLAGASVALANQFNVGTSPQSLVGLLAWHLRVLASVRDALDRASGKPTARELAVDLKLHPFVVSKALQQIPYYSSERITILYQELSVLDVQLKSARVDPQALFSVFLSRLASLRIGSAR